jgi:hypothetical protein
VGKAALEGLKGVSRVTKGWSGFMETDTVIYDKSIISVEEMERALRRAGTYRKTMTGE